MPDVRDAELNRVYESRAIKVGGFCAKSISITGSGEYAINAGAFSTKSGKIRPGQSFRIRLTSAATYNTTRSATVKVGEHLDPSFGIITGGGRPTTTFAVTTKSGAPAQSAPAQSAQLAIESPAVLSGPRAIEVDETRLRLLVIDPKLESLVSIDLVTGQHSVLSANDGANPATPFLDPREFALDSEDQTAWVIDQGYSDIMAVDLSSGQRTLLTDNSGAIDSQPIHNAQDIVFDSINNQLLVLVRTTASVDNDPYIVAIDPATGGRTRLTRTSESDSGYFFRNPVSLAFDMINARLLVLQPKNVTYPNGIAVMTVDPVTGEQGEHESVQPDLSDPRDASFDVSEARLLIADRFHGWIKVVDLTGSEPSRLLHLVGEPIHLALDTYNNRVLVVKKKSASIEAIDIASGE
jgi:hypothetical protein